MSFQPITFTYTPPATVETIASGTLNSPVVPTNQVTVTNASAIATALSNLRDTSEYLQSVILALNATTGVGIDSSVNPEFDRAFKAVYGTDQSAPSIVPIGLYNNWLDADIGVMQLESAAGVNSPVDVNQQTAASLATLTNTVENALLQNASYQSQVPLMLRILKTDSVVFQAWTDAVNAYPCQTNPGSTDVSSTVNDVINNAIDRYTSAYSSINSVLSGVGSVEGDVQNTVNFLQSQSTQDITRIVSLLNAAKGLIFKSSFTDITKDIANFAVARFAGECGAMVCLADRLAAAVIQPLQQTTGKLASLLQGAQGLATTVGTIPSGVMSGAVALGDAVSTTNQTLPPQPPSPSPSSVAAANFLQSNSAGVQSLGQQLNFALTSVSNGINSRLREFQRTINKRLSVHGNTLQILTMVRETDAIISIASSLSQQAGISFTSGVSVQSTSGSLITTPPVVPPIPSNVASILS